MAAIIVLSALGWRDCLEALSAVFQAEKLLKRAEEASGRVGFHENVELVRMCQSAGLFNWTGQVQWGEEGTQLNKRAQAADTFWLSVTWNNLACLHRQVDVTREFVPHMLYDDDPDVLHVIRKPP